MISKLKACLVKMSLLDPHHSQYVKLLNAIVYIIAGRGFVCLIIDGRTL